MLLDEILFPKYRRVQVSRAVFIIGVPRSATTFLFSLLYCDGSNFHGFKLWELALAPSICQKYIILFIRLIDNLISNPLYRFTKFLDHIIFGSFRDIHSMGICLPEEDEALFLYNFSSLYFYYFFPDVNILENLLYHDINVPEGVRKKNMNFYYRCIQRHNYVFDHANKKYFLSKNPTFIPKMQSISKRFPDAKFIYPLRSPYQTIPSTISLNAHIFSSFCKLPEPYPLQEKTRDFVISWYVHAHKILNEEIKERGLTILYHEIRDKPEDVKKKIYNFLGIDYKPSVEPQLEKRKKYRSKHVYDISVGIDKSIIDSKLGGIIPEDLLDPGD